MEIQSDKEGLSVTCRTLWIRSGAILTADRLKITCQSVTIEQSGIIDLNYKVSLCHFEIILFRRKIIDCWSLLHHKATLPPLSFYARVLEFGLVRRYCLGSGKRLEES